MKMAETIASFNIKEAALYSGLSVAMVDYLCRSAILEPSGQCNPGRGRARIYTFGDVVILRTLRSLLSYGVTIKRMKRAIENLKQFHPEITETSLPGRYLVTNGVDVFFRKNGEPLENLTQGGQLAFAFVVEIEEIRNQVNNAIKQKNAIAK